MYIYLILFLFCVWILLFQLILMKKNQKATSVSPSKKTTSRNSFMMNGTTLTKFIGQETRVVIPDGVTKIQSQAFYGCDSLTSVVIPDSVKEIGAYAFFGCNSLTSVEVPESMRVIGEFAFSGAPLTSFAIPKGLTEIGAGVFMVCRSLTSAIIPDGVVVIEGGAFYGCNSLTSVVIPNSVREIKPAAFGNCPALTGWSISTNHPFFKSDGTCLLTKDGQKIVSCRGTAEEYRIPEGVTVICEAAFSSCSFLTSLVIPESVKKIEKEAFIGCSNLTIHAPAGSVAETYAKENGIPFEAK